MHILFLTDNFPPEVNAPASRTHEHCRLWAARGDQVTVITCAPNFPQGKVLAGYRNALWQEEQLDGIRVIRVWSYITSNEGFIKRVLDYMSFMVSATLAALAVKGVDVIVGTSPQFFTACAAWMVSTVKRRPWIFELRDIWPESIKAVGAMNDSVVIRALERVEMFLYRKATRIVSVTHSFRRTLIRRGVDGGKIAVVTNGVDVSRFSPRPKDAALTNELGFAGKFVAGYVGTHGMAHALETLLEAAAILEQQGNDRFRFLLLGDGARKAELKLQAQRMGLRSVVFVDSVSKDEVTRYWSLLDVSVIHLRATELFTTVIPSKLFECMGMGLPVLHGVEGESADIVRQENVGIVFKPEDAQALALQLQRLQADPALCEQLKRNGLAAASRYDRTTLGLSMLQELRGAATSR